MFCFAVETTLQSNRLKGGGGAQPPLVGPQLLSVGTTAVDRGMPRSRRWPTTAVFSVQVCPVSKATIFVSRRWTGLLESLLCSYALRFSCPPPLLCFQQNSPFSFLGKSGERRNEDRSNAPVGDVNGNDVVSKPRGFPPLQLAHRLNLQDRMTLSAS